MGYIPYPKALKLLQQKNGTTPEELAAWVWMGPKEGGLTAYLNANELNPPPRFFYDPGDGSNPDYLGPLMRCWFDEVELAQFEPQERYISARALIERWSQEPGISPEPFMRAKIAESQLIDIHPLFGGTRGSFPEELSLPPMEDAIFALSHVRAVESLEFSATPQPEEPKEPPDEPAGADNTAKQLVVGSPEWRRRNAQRASEARHNRPGGSRDKQRQIREIWASGKYTSKDICAEQECGALNMSISAARKALRNAPAPRRTDQPENGDD